MDELSSNWRGGEKNEEETSSSFSLPRPHLASRLAKALGSAQRSLGAFGYSARGFTARWQLEIPTEEAMLYSTIWGLYEAKHWWSSASATPRLIPLQRLVIGSIEIFRWASDVLIRRRSFQCMFSPFLYCVKPVNTSNYYFDSVSETILNCDC